MLSPSEELVQTRPENVRPKTNGSSRKMQPGGPSMRCHLGRRRGRPHGGGEMPASRGGAVAQAVCLLATAMRTAPSPRVPEKEGPEAERTSWAPP